jgi:uroporphyrinogen decarboxylase
MTSRELMIRTLRFQATPRPARDLWVLPWAERHCASELAAIRRDFPSDVAYPTEVIALPPCNGQRGHPHTVGSYVDEWGCEFVNLQDGVIGEVKHPVVEDYGRDLDKVRPPWEWAKIPLDEVWRFCEGSDRFVGSILCFRLFERMQFLRGTENLYVDLLDRPAGLFKLTERIHEWNLAMIDAWTKTPVDFIVGMDDWGSQRSLLIAPRLWREFFKPLYAEYIRRIKAAGKFAFFHSDGYIFDIYEDLIEIGVDAVNSQLFCMDIEEIGRRFKGRLTFWGEIDRQHILPSSDVLRARHAVHRVARALYDGHGGVIAQCEFGAGAQPQTVRAVYEEWDRMGAMTSTPQELSSNGTDG